MIHIEHIDVRGGGSYADNLTWLSNLIARECNCQCFIFWNVGTSFLLSGGSVGQLFNINKVVEDVVVTMGVQIRNTSVSLKHKFVLVPLAYNKETCDRDYIELQTDRAAGNIPVVGQSFSKFMDYNDKVMTDVRKSFPKSYEQLLDLNKLLAVKTLKSTCRAFGKECTMVKYRFRDGNNPNDSKMMNDKDRKDYFVSLVKWVKLNYEEETLKQITLKGVPAKKISIRLVPR